VEIWGGHHDLGRDAYSDGSLPFPNRLLFRKGPFVFQCKFVENAGQLGRQGLAALKRQLGREAKKLLALSGRDDRVPPRHYAVMTNVAIPGSAREAVRGAIRNVLPETEVHLIDSAQLEAMLDGAPEVRASFPQVLSFRDLAEIVSAIAQKDLRARSQGLVEQAEDLAGVFVPTGAYRRALAIVESHNFVVLTGHPEVGKTSIARMLSLAQAALGWEVIDCIGPEDFHSGYDEGRSQIFVADDAFGSAEYRPEAGEAWGRSLPLILRKISARHWLVFTSRSHPLTVALDRMPQRDAMPAFPSEAEVVVDVTHLSREDRANILYRHAKAVELSDRGRRIVRRNSATIVDSEHFTPLRVRRLVGEVIPSITTGVASSKQVEAKLRRALEHSGTSMRQAFASLDADQRSFLIALLDVGSPPFGIDEVTDAYERHNGERGGRSAKALAPALLGQFVEADLAIKDGFRWAHPSCRDVVVEYLLQRPKERRQFLERAGPVAVELALGSVETTAGEARLEPLVQSAKDWAALRSRSVELVTRTTVDEQRTLLVSARELWRALDGDSATREAAEDLIGDLLGALRSEWSRSSTVIGPGELEAFYAASLLVSPLCPSPPLEGSLDHHLAVFDARVTKSQLDAYESALAFLTLVAGNEPRLLQAIEATRLTRALRRLLAAIRRVNRDAEAFVRRLELNERLRSAETRARSMAVELLRWRVLAEQAGELDEDLREQAAWLARDLLRTERTLQHWLHAKAETERRGHVTQAYADRAGVQQRPPSDRLKGMPLDELFATL